MDARIEFVRLASAEGANVRLLCRRFGVSPTTGYKWLERHAVSGVDGLREASRRPLNSPRRSAASVETLILETRAAHPAWGGRKIRAVLLRAGVKNAPAPSTITAVLRRHGLPNPYEQLKALTRGQGITADSMRAFVESLDLPAEDKQRLREMTPGSYTGLAERLARAI